VADPNAIQFTDEGAFLPQYGRSWRLFKITAGTNPYAATDVWLDQFTGTVAAQAAGWNPAVATKDLWEINGVATVAANTIVIGYPNAEGTGFFFDSDPAAFALDVRNTDGTAIDANTTSIRFDKATGLSTAGTAGTSTVSGLAAGTTQMGMVTTGTDVWGGTKAAAGWALTGTNVYCYPGPTTNTWAFYTSIGASGTPTANVSAAVVYAQTGFTAGGAAGVSYTRAVDGFAVQVFGGIVVASAAAIAVKTANYNVTASDGTLLGDTSGGSFAFTMPAASGVSGQIKNIKKVDATNTLTISPTGGDTFYSSSGGNASLALTADGSSFTLQADGANNRWVVL
jgi:hypothetical protein